MRRKTVGAALALLLVGTGIALAGCGSDSSSSDKASTSGDAASTTGSGQYDQLLADAYKGNFGELPTTGPAPAKDKKVWVISAGEQVDSYHQGALGVMQAGKVLGWDMTLYDGKLNPANYNAGVQQAVAAGADGVVLHVVDCVQVRPALKEAKAKGIKVVGFQDFDCDDPNVGGKALFDARPVMQGTQKYDEVVKRWSAIQADWITAKTNGKAKIIGIKQDELLVLKYAREGFEEELAKVCPGCEIVETVNIKGTDFGPKLQQKMQTAILQHPEANVVYSLYDGVMSSGVGAAVVASGRNDDLLAVGGEGFEVNADMVRRGRGDQDAGSGFHNNWAGWAAADTMNRVFAGEQPVESGVGFQAYDAEHNLPASGPWTPVGTDGKPIDYKGAYKKVFNSAGSGTSTTPSQ